MFINFSESRVDDILFSFYRILDDRGLRYSTAVSGSLFIERKGAVGITSVPNVLSSIFEGRFSKATAITLFSGLSSDFDLLTDNLKLSIIGQALNLSLSEEFDLSDSVNDSALFFLALVSDPSGLSPSVVSTLRSRSTPKVSDTVDQRTLISRDTLSLDRGVILTNNTDSGATSSNRSSANLKTNSSLENSENGRNYLRDRLGRS